MYLKILYVMIFVFSAIANSETNTNNNTDSAFCNLHKGQEFKFVTTFSTIGSILGIPNSTYINPMTYKIPADFIANVNFCPLNGYDIIKIIDTFSVDDSSRKTEPRYFIYAQPSIRGLDCSETTYLFEVLKCGKLTIIISTADSFRQKQEKALLLKHFYK